MMMRTTSHRSREKLERAIGRHPQYFFTMQDGGCFVKLDAPPEIEKALRVTGVTRCRVQDESKYMQCWDTGVAR